MTDTRVHSSSVGVFVERVEREMKEGKVTFGRLEDTHIHIQMHTHPHPHTQDH